MGRGLVWLGALLLAATAGIHAGGVSMVAGWAAGLGPREAAALRLVWLSDSLDWAVVASLWAIAGWRGGPGWTGAAAVAGLIPLAAGIAVFALDPGFFGGWMLLASCALAGTGLVAILKHGAAG